MYHMKTSTTSPAIGSTLVSAIEEAWAAIAKRHPDLPANIVAITGSGSKGNGWLTRGHWSAARWETEGQSLPGVFVSGERLADGARGVMATLIHEAAHGLAHVRGIQETSRQGRWHNKRFVELANELGLTTATEADPKIGFSATEWNDALEAEYATEIETLEAALLATIPDLFSKAMEWAVVLGWMLTVCGHGAPSTREVASSLRPVAKPRRRKVTLECGCANGGLDVFEDLAGTFDLTCNVCDEALAVKGAS